MSTTTRKCPICGKPRSAEHTPFCGLRCRDRDLVKWLDDGYALPGPAADDPEAGSGLPAEPSNED